MEIKEKPKYQTLKEYIINVIQDGKIKQDEQIYSENELAEKFNISRQTVRQAIGELVNDGWLYRIQGKGTFVNSTNISNAPKIIGVIISFLDNYIFPSIVQGIEQKLAKENYNIFLSCTYNRYEKEKTCIENLLNQNISGVIVESVKSSFPNPNIELYQKLAEKGIPILFIHSLYTDFQCSYLVQDDKKAGYIATKYLIDNNHKNIGGIFKFDYKQGILRFEGFQQALNESQIDIDDNRIIWFDDDDIEYKLKSKKIITILKTSTAIVCYNDEIAIKLMPTIQKLGLNIPDDISIISFDDSAMSLAVKPQLSTIVHPKNELGQRAAEIIIDLINHKSQIVEEKIEPVLIKRDSVKNV